MEFLVIEAVVGVMFLLYLFETYLDLRQYAVLKLPTLPLISQGAISPERFRKFRTHSIDKSRLYFVHEFATTLVDCMILLHNILPWLWKRSGSLVSCIGLNAENEILHSLSFLAAMTLLSQIFEFPFSLYSTFVIEARHGSNEKTIGQFLKEWLLGQCISLLLGAPIVAAAVGIVQNGGSYLVFWLFSLLGSVATTTLYPRFIAPLFNKFTPLPNGELRRKIVNLAASLNFPLEKIFVEDGSGRTTHSHAYMFGVQKKSIVLNDALFKQCRGTDEITAIIAHEMGHWKLNHTVYAFVAMQHIVMPVQRLLEFCMNLLSRSSEFKADAFAKNLGYGRALRAGLIKLQDCNLSVVNTDPWYSAYRYSHPPLVERLNALDESMKKSS
ncbi:caax prenyl protease 1 like protein [Quercus suber]|uniref:CAAX prenyl protease n=1 Tax=Quercus suber TaxID=58331 RepID=A0AAW0KJR2_QUESU